MIRQSQKLKQGWLDRSPKLSMRRLATQTKRDKSTLFPESQRYFRAVSV